MDPRFVKKLDWKGTCSMEWYSQEKCGIRLNTWNIKVSAAALLLWFR